jgi:hypothetical protein
VPAALVEQILEALAELDDARAALARVRAGQDPLGDRRAANARVREAFERADVLLRRATGIARTGSYRDWGDWALWRDRLSRLDAARQAHLLAEHEERAVLPINSVRALDTGMGGPDLGELQHGRSRPPGAAPSYGLDIESVLAATAAAELEAAPARAELPEASRARQGSTPNVTLVPSNTGPMAV